MLAQISVSVRRLSSRRLSALLAPGEMLTVVVIVPDLCFVSVEQFVLVRGRKRLGAVDREAIEHGAHPAVEPLALVPVLFIDIDAALARALEVCTQLIHFDVLDTL